MGFASQIDSVYATEVSSSKVSEREAVAGKIRGTLPRHHLCLNP